MNSDSGVDTSTFAPPTAQVPTNVTRITRALNHRDQNGIPQVAFYQRGVGTDGDEEDELVGGLSGDDISEHIREAYAFLANNFDPESQEDVDDPSKPMDEIVILGFSRGAYTARAIATLITDVGLLTKKGMEDFWGIFGDWMKQDVKGNESKWFKSAYGKFVPFTDPEYRGTLIKNKLTRWGMPIRAVGCWDTVGALGIPLPWNGKNVKPYSFVNAKVAQHVQHAFHALAIDEHRNLFTPTLWEQPDHPHKLNKLKQCWFPGTHSNIGGSWPDAGISNITLAWMISQLEDTDGGILSFDPEYLNFVQDLNNQYYATVPEPIRPWGFGKLYDSSIVSGVGTLPQAIDPITRTPGRYCETSTEDGKQTTTRLTNTNECIHRCVRVRIDGGGPGLQELATTSTTAKVFEFVKEQVGINAQVMKELPTYVSPALANYELEQAPNVEVEVDQASSGSSGAYWTGKDGLGNLPEDMLGRTEIRLWQRSVETKAQLEK
jgi:hypothetical protein